jgi:hypothetical protein
MEFLGRERQESSDASKHDSPLNDIWLLWKEGVPVKDGTLVQLGGAVLAGGFGGTLSRVLAPPLPSDLQALVLKYPRSGWCQPLPRYQPASLTMRQLAQWEKTGVKGFEFPGAQRLLEETQQRALVSSVGSAICGSALNYVLDNTVYKSQPYGPYTATFDTAGVGLICTIPLPLRTWMEIPTKTAMIVLGHILCRRHDRAVAESNSSSMGLGKAPLHPPDLVGLRRATAVGDTVNIWKPPEQVQLITGGFLREHWSNFTANSALPPVR